MGIASYGEFEDYARQIRGTLFEERGAAPSDTRFGARRLRRGTHELLGQG